MISNIDQFFSAEQIRMILKRYLKNNYQVTVCLNLKWINLFCRTYLPVLKGYPAKYIYEPWTAPESVQRAAKCIIGKDYPVPMVNHAEVSKLNTGRMKQVYQQLAVYASIGN